MPAISNRLPAVNVSYLSAGKRVTKHFSDAYVARRFFTRQDKLGNSPKVVGATTMTEQTTPVQDQAAVTPAPTGNYADAVKSKKAAVKKASTKKAAPTKKAATKKSVQTKTAAVKKAPKAKKEAEAPMYGAERSHDLPWNDKKVAIFKALKTLKATSASAAKSAGEIAEKADVSNRDVRHYVYHAKAAGLTDIAAQEEESVGRGYRFYLTAKGAALDPAKELKEQNAGK